MRPSEIVSTLTSLIPTKRPLFLHGPPGVGKSSLVREACGVLKMAVCDIRAVLLDPVDLRGLPSINKAGQAHWCQPSFLPHDPDWQGVLFLDELPQAPPLVQSACLQLTLDRRIGEYLLPEGASVIAAGNRSEDRAGAHRLITPLLNRFIHVDLDVDNADWQAWACTSGVSVEVRSFLNFRPALLFCFQPATQQRAFPTPRSWSFVSDVMPHIKGGNMHQIVAGCVGEGPAAEFVGFVKTFMHLPDVDELLKRPSGFKPPSDPAILYALCGAISERVKKDDPKVWSAIYEVADRLPDEYCVLLIRDSGLINRKILNEKICPGAGAFLKKHRGIFENR